MTEVKFCHLYVHKNNNALDQKRPRNKVSSFASTQNDQNWPQNLKIIPNRIFSWMHFRNRMLSNLHFIKLYYESWSLNYENIKRYPIWESKFNCKTQQIMKFFLYVQDFHCQLSCAIEHATGKSKRNVTSAP